MISRGFFTTHLLTELAGFALPVGDNDAPDAAHGWQGEPNENLAEFIPWLVLAPGTSLPAGTGTASPAAASTIGEPSSALIGPAPLPLAWWQAAQLAA